MKKELRNLLLETREQSGLKQKEMAAALVMSDTAYSEKERGCNMCGTLTTVLLLASRSDASEVLKNLHQKLLEAYAREQDNQDQDAFYRVIATSRRIGIKQILTYGISVQSHSKDYESFVIPDIATDREDVEELAALCNRLQLSPIHLADVIEDFLGRA